MILERGPASHRDERVGDAARPSISVVVPLFEEEALMPVLVARLARALDELGVEAEVILVDDGSTDRTCAEIARAHARDPRFRGVSLSRNFGHQAAITAGMRHARGGSVVVMDGDLQDPPEAIGPLWRKLQEGYDVVYAVRASRPEGRLKRWAYQAYYRLLGRLTAIEIPRDAGDFGIMSRRVASLLNALPERKRFVRGLRAWAGFRQTGLWIDRSPRHAGRPKFTIAKLVSLACDGVVGFSDAPLRYAGVVGAILAMLAASAGVLCAGRSALGWGTPPGWFWLSLMLGFSTGAQLLFLAILGEYVSRIFHEVNGRPPYVVRRRIGIGPPRRRNRAHARHLSEAEPTPESEPDWPRERASEPDLIPRT